MVKNNCRVIVFVAVLMMMCYITSSVTAQQVSGILAEKKKQLSEVDSTMSTTRDLIQGALDFGPHNLQASYVKGKKDQLVELGELRATLQYEVDFLSKQVVGSSKQDGMVINSVNTNPTIAVSQAPIVASPTKEELAKQAAAELKSKQEAELKLKQEAEAKAQAEKQAAEKKAAEELKMKQLKAEQEAAAKLAEEKAKDAEFTIEAACDNSYTLYVNGNQVISGSDWGTKQSAKRTLKSGDLITVLAYDLDAYGGLLVNIYNAKGVQFSTGYSTWNCKVGSLTANAATEFSSWPAAVKAPHSDNYGVPKKSGSHWVWTKSQQRGYITCATRVNF